MTLSLFNTATLSFFHTVVLHSPLLPLPPPHPHLQPHRLPQKPLPRLHPHLPQLKLIPPKHRPHYKRQLHLRHVPPHASPRPITKRDERILLLLAHVPPSLGAELVRVGAPDFLAVVDGVGGDGEHGAGGEVVVEEGDAGAGGDDAGEAEGGGAVDAHCFFDDGVEVGEVADLGEGGDGVDVWNRGVQLGD